MAAACYPIGRAPTFRAWQDEMAAWVADGAGRGADLLVFPEYGAMPLAALGAGSGLDAEVTAVSERLPAAWDHVAELARAHGVHILAPSGPFGTRGSAVNRAMLVAPDGTGFAQDKRILTPWEREPLALGPEGASLRIAETALGPLGILVCYDAEFPLHARALVEAGASVILVPSCTETAHGRNRVRIAARARALEGQCFTVLSMTTSAPQDPDWCDVVGASTGLAGVYGPPDGGFPADGVIAEGIVDAPGWVAADLDLRGLDAVRAAGGVAGLRDWPRSACGPVERAEPGLIPVGRGSI